MTVASFGSCLLAVVIGWLVAIRPGAAPSTAPSVPRDWQDGYGDVDGCVGEVTESTSPKFSTR